MGGWGEWKRRRAVKSKAGGGKRLQMEKHRPSTLFGRELRGESLAANNNDDDNNDTRRACQRLDDIHPGPARWPLVSGPRSFLLVQLPVVSRGVRSPVSGGAGSRLSF